MEEVYSDEELAEFFSNEENLYLLDFTLPMLESYFFDEEITEYIKAASVSFVEYCVEEYGMSKAYRLCMDTSDKGQEKLVEIKNDWLAEISATSIYTEYGKLPFVYNYEKEMESYPYVIKAESSNWYFSPTDVKKIGYCAFVDEYCKTVQVAEEDFAEAQDVLKEYIPKDLPSVDIFMAFYKDDEVRFSDYYDYAETNAIWACKNWDILRYELLHEYVHYLTLGENKIFEANTGLVEGVTDEVATIECENRLLQMYWADNMTEEDYKTAQEVGIWDAEGDQLKLDVLYYCNAKRFYDRVIKSDYQSISLVTMFQPNKMTLGALSYSAGASMTKYLMETYGMEDTFAYCTDVAKLQELTGKTFLELYDEWGVWNELRYQELKTM